MAVFDGVLLTIFSISMLLGAWRGFVFELLSLIGWIAGFFAARWVAQDVANWLPLQSFDPAVQYGVGFVLTFVLAVFAWGFISALAKKMIDAVGLRPVDRTLGAVFGLIRAAVLVMVVSVVVVSTPLHQQSWWTQSVAAPWLASAVTNLLPSLSMDWGRWLPSSCVSGGCSCSGCSLQAKTAGEIPQIDGTRLCVESSGW